MAIFLQRRHHRARPRARPPAGGIPANGACAADRVGGPGGPAEANDGAAAHAAVHAADGDPVAVGGGAGGEVVGQDARGGALRGGCDEVLSNVFWSVISKRIFSTRTPASTSVLMCTVDSLLSFVQCTLLCVETEEFLAWGEVP